VSRRRSNLKLEFDSNEFAFYKRIEIEKDLSFSCSSFGPKASSRPVPFLFLFSILLPHAAHCLVFPTRFLFALQPIRPMATAPRATAALQPRRLPSVGRLYPWSTRRTWPLCSTKISCCARTPPPAPVSFPRLAATMQGSFSLNHNERRIFPQIQNESSLLLDSIGDHDRNPPLHLLDIVPLYMVHLGSPHDTFPHYHSRFHASPPTPSRSTTSQALPPGREAQSESSGAAPPLALDGSPPEQATADRLEAEKKDTTASP
jgi:hypothetical protein